MKPNLTHEKKLWHQGYKAIAGVDEVGRGAWAGPLLAVAVVLPVKFKRKSWHKLVKDSKSISPSRRRKIYQQAAGEIEWAAGIVSNQEIDKSGVAWANKKAVNSAVSQLKRKPDFVLTDYIANLGAVVAGHPASAIIKGDAKVFSIALASVIAKVTRDEMMVTYEAKYPGYGFAQHKGYGTRQHLLALKKLGPCPIHRRTYRPLARWLL